MVGSEQSAAITCRVPLLRTWMCASMKPGSTVLPGSSIILVFGPTSVSRSESLPTPMKRPSRIATAVALGRLGSMVMTLVRRMTVSA